MNRPHRTCRSPLALAFVFALAFCAQGCKRDADEPEVLRVAVASNFYEVAKRIALRFEESTGQSIEVSPGSSGKLVAQIRAGAPYHVFLSADRARPLALEKSGEAIPHSRFTYAEGILALHWGLRVPPAKLDGSLSSWLNDRRQIAMADADVAPYGAAARRFLIERGVWRNLQDKLVTGESIGQAYQFVASGNAPAGFVARSQVRERFIALPSAPQAPLIQEGVRLRPPAGKAPHPGAETFVEFLLSEEIQQHIARAGYRVAASSPSVAAQ